MTGTYSVAFKEAAMNFFTEVAPFGPPITFQVVVPFSAEPYRHRLGLSTCLPQPLNLG